jgi:acyl carrier protein phosphodiesterase
MMDFILLRKTYKLLLLCCLCLPASLLFAEENINQQINFAERLTRLEEGQKAILLEMRTRFQAVDQRFQDMEKRFEQRFEAIDQRFEAIDQRFDAIEQRFESIDQRFISIDQRFESVLREMDKRFEALNMRIDDRFSSIDDRFTSIDNHFNYLNNFCIALMTSIIALFGYTVWDRKTAMDKADERFEKIILKYFNQYDIKPDQNMDNDVTESDKQQTIATKQYDNTLSIIQDKLNYILDVISQVPEIKQIMNAGKVQGKLVPA